MKNYDRMEKKRFYLAYKLTFIVLFGGCFFPFFSKKIAMLWALDGLPVIFPSFSYLGDYFSSCIKRILSGEGFRLPMYDITLGWGSGVIPFFSVWYFEPTQLLSAFASDIPTKIFLYEIATLLKLYFAGVAFSAYCFRKHQPTYSVYIASFIYVFSTYTLYIGIRFPAFLLAMVFLPLLLIGIEDSIKDGYSVVFVLAVAMSACCHIYFLYINVIFCVLYYLLLSFCNLEKTTITDCLKYGVSLALQGLLGIGIAAVFLFPTICNLMISNRHNPVISTGSLLSYGMQRLQSILLYMNSPMTTGMEPGKETYIGMIPLSIPSLYLLFSAKGKKNWKALVVVLFLSLCIPASAFLFTAFSNISNRWTFLWVFTLSYIICLGIFRMLQPDRKLLAACLLAMTVLIGILLFYPTFQNTLTITGIFILCGVVTLLALFTVLKNKRTKKVLLALFTFSGILLFAYQTYHVGYINEFAGMDYLNEKLDNYIGASIRENDPNGIYRVEINHNRRDDLGNSYMHGVASTGIYCNSMDANTFDFMHYIENSGNEENIISYDLDARTKLMALLSTKYFAADNTFGEYLVPYGYSFVGDYGKYSVYKNDYPLPIAYAYDTYTPASALDAWSALEREDIYLHSAVIDDAQCDSISDKIQLASYESSVRDVPIEIMYEGISLREDGLYQVEYPGASMTITAKSAKRNRENYLRFSDMHIREGYPHWSFVVTAQFKNQRKDTGFAILSSINHYNPGMDSYTINLGYSDERLRSVRVTFPHVGIFDMGKVYVQQRKMDQYIDDVKALQKNAMDDIKVDGHIISGKVTLPQDGILCFSLPYSTGWKVYIDDKLQKSMCVNTAFLGVALDKGKHDIKAVYTTPGLKVGELITLISIIVFIIYSIVFYRMRKGICYSRENKKGRRRNLKSKLK